MIPSTKKLHEKIIRHLKGILHAWEEWITEQEKAPEK
jgi:hypothetical protein